MIEKLNQKTNSENASGNSSGFFSRIKFDNLYFKQTPKNIFPKTQENFIYRTVVLKIMKVEHLPVHRFLEGSNKSFIVPVYQRDYAWNKIQCEKLWDDLVYLGENEKADHFLGILVTDGEGYDEYTIIDGQQRLTTISIFLIALHNYIKDKKSLTDLDNKLIGEILDLLINRHSSEKNKRIRLKPNKHDKEFFDELFTQDDENIKKVDSNILSNYIFFQSKIKSSDFSPEKIFGLFKRLKIVLIHLDRKEDDDPQLIFESLNSTGVDLTSGDLIRNYILMDLNPSEQERMHRDYWVKIEKVN